jgi:hypothetical protein
VLLNEVDGEIPVAMQKTEDNEVTGARVFLSTGICHLKGHCDSVCAQSR